MQDPLPRFAVLARRLLSAVKNFEQAIQGQSRAVTEAIEASKAQQGPPPEVHVRAEVNLSQGVEVHKTEADARNDKSYQSRTLLVAWLTFIALVIYAVISGWQLYEMRKATWDTGVAAQAATDQTKLLRQQLVGSQAAVIEIKPDWDGTGTEPISILVRNSGHLISAEVHIGFTVSKEAISNDVTRKIIWKSNVRHYDLKDLPPSDQWYFQPSIYQIEKPFAAIDEELVQETKEVVIVQGDVQYDNGFRATNEPLTRKPFCFSFFRFTYFNGVGTVHGGGDFAACDEFMANLPEFLRLERRIK